ncbi:hypothetical protein OOZ54_18225 [Rhodopseudomonas palustris]|uniref:hypothetical protein n=1 Tax=Rhodopseudomonas palustris TaxID=1076 RepID=UPI0022F01633|nr:hypothetical protein [Rhodopseudomonas palustris]WBU28589.1 hypothetical protein OOZ54_18225 [Rhodopseudomonas palustris]
MSALRRQWLWPIVLAAATVFGLLAALIGEGGVWQALSWGALAVPLVTIVLCLARRHGGPSSLAKMSRDLD